MAKIHRPNALHPRDKPGFPSSGSMNRIDSRTVGIGAAVDSGDHAARDHLWIGKGLRDRVDRPRRHADRLDHDIGVGDQRAWTNPASLCPMIACASAMIRSIST
ncbi:hypothetical protein BH10PSE15_BH10PSE15_01090 [soil metagenome]